MIVDAHLHCSGNEKSEDVLRALDEAGVDVAVLLAPFLTDPYTLADARVLRSANDHVARLVHGHADRLIGFAVVNPLHSGAADDLEDAVQRFRLRGLKLAPSGWFPYDACAPPGVRARRCAAGAHSLPQRDFYRWTIRSILSARILRGSA